MSAQDDIAATRGASTRSHASKLDDSRGVEVREASPRHSNERQASTPHSESVEPSFPPSFQHGAPRMSRSAAGDWRRLFAEGAPETVLRRIVEGDPLRVRADVSESLRDRCLFVDGERVTTRALARVARAAQDYRGRPAVRTWLRARCDEAIDDILDEDREALRDPASSPSSAFVALARPLGLDAARMREACVSFNALPRVERTAFFAVVLAREPIEAFARRSGISQLVASQRSRRALEAILNPPIHRNEEELP